MSLFELLRETWHTHPMQAIELMFCLPREDEDEGLEFFIAIMDNPVELRKIEKDLEILSHMATIFVDTRAVGEYKKVCYMIKQRLSKN